MQNRYLSPSRVYHEAQERLKELEEVSLRLERKVKKYPEGKIHIVKSDRRVQFYLRHNAQDKSGEYMTKKDHGKIRIYVMKHYEEKVLSVITKEIAGLKRLLKSVGSAAEELQRIYSDKPEEVREMIEPIDLLDEDYIREWEKRAYTPKELGNVVSVYKSDKGDLVRSKSELNIANHLYKRGIPYKYEAPLYLGSGATIYPDFTILDVARRREIYWEHRGMMDDRDYSRHAIHRVKIYMRENILLGDTLIITEETSAEPLGTDEIEQVIRSFTE